MSEPAKVVAVPVHFMVSALDGREVSREQAIKVVESCLEELEFMDYDRTAPFTQVPLDDGIYNVSLAPDADEDPVHEDHE